MEKIYINTNFIKYLFEWKFELSNIPYFNKNILIFEPFSNFPDLRFLNHLCELVLLTSISAGRRYWAHSRTRELAPTSKDGLLEVNIPKNVDMGEA